MQRRTPALVLAAALSLGTLAACGSSAGSDSSSSDTSAPKADKTTTTAAAEPLQILVGNDDGYAAEGIDMLVKGLQTLDDVEITVVAPLTQQSGQGGKTTEGELEVTDVELKSGYPAKAVDGYPADAINVAFDELGVEPDVVITGINEGQNVGPLVDVSGTVGAARAGVAHGVPALATSQGTDAFDYESAWPFILDWITDRREALQSGDAPVEVMSMNIPSCKAGRIRGLLEVEVGTDGTDALGMQDCVSTLPEDGLTTDVKAFLNGFVSLTEVPAEPATPPEVTPAG
ncbi:5'/3'-nucleotidase SurE [Aquihabitans daechungensis]|uniref:5'/3'-nucleotidase SurE n=1 Tax=Aquihabitans daechungensis TaxID=1052257 RepID=UPI003BA06A3D